MAEARYPALAVRDRAASWAKTDDRVLVALVHGSVASGAVTELSDVDLVVVTKPGLRDAVWSDRAALSEQLLGAPVVEAHDVPHQRPYRWQARAANLCGLDLTLDDGTVDWWPGLAHEVTFLVDRSGAAAARAEWMTREREPEFDVLAADNETWALISWVAGCLLHGRTMLARLVLGDLVAARVAPVAGQPLYAIDGSLRDRFEPTLPTSFDPLDITRALRAAADLYEELLAEWAVTTGCSVPVSLFRPAVRTVLDRLEDGSGIGLAPTEADPTP